MRDFQSPGDHFIMAFKRLRQRAKGLGFRIPGHAVLGLLRVQLRQFVETVRPTGLQSLSPKIWTP